jgi:uncharacterized membrane protein
MIARSASQSCLRIENAYPRWVMHAIIRSVYFAPTHFLLSFDRPKNRTRFAMGIRNFRERIFQAVTCELGGILIATPLYALVAGAGPQESLVLIVTLSVVATVWVLVHNTIFDLVEWRLTHRSASDRPRTLRMAHAVSLEVTLMILTVPVIWIMGGHSFWQAIALDLGLSLVYLIYVYVFHLAYDWVRPVR